MSTVYEVIYVQAENIIEQVSKNTVKDAASRVFSINSLYLTTVNRRKVRSLTQVCRIVV